LLTVVVDDAAIAWLAQPVASTPAPQQRRAGRVAQAVVLASGALRVSIWLLILVLLLAPFGEGPGELLSRTQRLQIGITIGELQLRPAALLQSLLVLALALAALKALRRWLAERFLPTTSLDAGMRTSLVTLSSFIGSVIATALALSALGLTLDKVAWIASGLSVGIGFGLQAVVSNFVSGLILLAERPVKIGDWVTLGNVEGDIQRINVRATEIRMADRSTVIVPNSELLTKVVRNVTRDDAPGLVQLKLPLPLDADSERARSILLGALARHPDVLEQPPPSVLIDTVEGGKLVFSATGFVASPRHVPATRSDLWFRVLSDMRSAGLAV
jgi:potassium-dependent mechanosensitive channel